MFVDSHCHLNMLQSAPTDTMAAAAAAGVEYCLNISVGIQSFPQVLAAARDFSNVSATVGVHPGTRDEAEVSVEELVRLADDPKIQAIGETGLDYHYNKGDLEWQRERFRRHIRAAREIGKPLVIHNRDSKEDLLRLLHEEKADEAGGVMHCFVEDLDTAQQAMDLGFYISFSGIVTFKNAQALKEVAKQIPLEKMLIETDSPYLAPVPHRGKPNQPAYVAKVAEYIAELREDSVENIAAATTRNFYSLFGLNN